MGFADVWMSAWAMIGYINGIQFAADMSHLASLVLLSKKIAMSRSCKGISLKTVELYAVVFIFRYLDLFTRFISWYNVIMKLLFITVTLTVIYQMRFRPSVRETYDKARDSFRYEILLLGSAAIACVCRPPIPNHNLGWRHESAQHLATTPLLVMQIMFQMSMYLEAVAILPQLTLLIKTEDIDTLTGNYVFLLGLYRGLYIVNWTYKYVVTPASYARRIMFQDDWRKWLAGVVQTLIYAEFFFYYVRSWRRNEKLKVPTLCAMREEELCELTNFSCVGTMASPPAETGLRQRLLNTAIDGEVSESDVEAASATPPALHSSPQRHVEIPRFHKSPAKSSADSSSSPQSMHGSHVNAEGALLDQQLQVVEVSHGSSPDRSSAGGSLDSCVAGAAESAAASPENELSSETLGLQMGNARSSSGGSSSARGFGESDLC